MKVVNRLIKMGFVVLVTAGPVLPASAAKLSWFDDAPFAGVGALGGPDAGLRSLTNQYTSFGLNLYRAQDIAAEDGYTQDSSELATDSGSVRVYGEIEANHPSRLIGSVQDHESQDNLNRRVNTLGLKWQHRLNAINSFAVSAEYGEGVSVYPSTLNTQDARAAFSWTSRIPSSLRSSITGSVFLGDEMAREDIYRHLGRRYYGFEVGGSVTFFQTHTPYVSLKMQKSVYDATEDALFVSARSDDRSLLSAGWKWQVQRDLNLQAEASYGFGNPANPELYTSERSRIFFGTRFDFK